MADYLTRAELLSALTETHEKTITPALFGGGQVLIRELIGKQRLLANEAATAASPDAPDNALYRAMLVQSSVVDPDSGTPGPDGRIDPRTRTPLFAVADVQNIVNGRDLLLAELVEEIAALAALPPRFLFRGHRAADGAERDAHAGAEAGADAAQPDAGGGVGDAHGRADVSAEPGAAGADVGSVE